MMLPLDPRVRVRDALRALVEEDPARWDKPSLFVLRNRLLDRTGSDARPFAEFLIEALRRGWRDRLPGGTVDAARFDATVAPFVMQWSRERFIQPEMARWAVESWAYAMRVIDESQLRIAPPPKRESMAAMASRLNAGAAAAGAQAATAARAVATAMNTTSPGRTRPAQGQKAPQQPAGGRGRSGNTSGGPSRPGGANTGAYAPAYTTRPRGTGRSVPSWIPKTLFGILVVMGLGVIGRVAVGTMTDGPTDAELAARMTAARAPNTGPGGGAAASGSAGNPTLASLPLSSGAALASARTVAPSLTGGVSIVAPEKPGVPSITRGLLSTGADSTRMVFVQPARRAAGDGRRMASPSTTTPITFDELHFVSGDIMRGRVEVVRAGTVIFRDMRTGLRHEYNKDDVAEVITEFGTIVRFRAEAATTPNTAAAKVTAKGAKGASALPAPKRRGVRAKGVAGRYRIRYAAASAVGSPECTQVWTRPPNAEDIAVVTHIPDADTLAVSFQGGDVFPSNVDPDGYFASTFRIVPDQARTMTALTTRLNGRFTDKGALDLTVNIVFYRRLRAGELTCNVTVKAAGQREQ